MVFSNFEVPKKAEINTNHLSKNEKNKYLHQSAQIFKKNTISNLSGQFQRLKLIFHHSVSSFGKKNILKKLISVFQVLSIFFADFRALCED